MTCLITGATGAVGRHIVDDLLGAGARVRALTRSPQKAALPSAVEIVGGDLEAPDALPNGLFADVDRIFVFPAEAGVERFAGQAAAAGCRRFVVLSSLAAAGEHERDHGSVSNVHHLAVERAVLQTGVPTTVLRPGTFANNLLFWAQPIRFQGGVQEPYPDSAQAPIHEADIAAVAVLALLEDGNEGNVYPLTGPQALTRAEQLETIGRAIGRELTFTQTAPEAFAESMRQYIPQEIITMLLDYWSDTVSEPDLVRDTVENLTGQPGRTLAQWAHDHIADFTG